MDTLAVDKIAIFLNLWAKRLFVAYYTMFTISFPILAESISLKTVEDRQYFVKPEGSASDIKVFYQFLEKADDVYEIRLGKNLWDIKEDEVFALYDDKKQLLAHAHTRDGTLFFQTDKQLKIKLKGDDDKAITSGKFSLIAPLADVLFDSGTFEGDTLLNVRNIEFSKKTKTVFNGNTSLNSSETLSVLGKVRQKGGKVSIASRVFSNRGSFSSQKKLELVTDLFDGRSKSSLFSGSVLTVNYNNSFESRGELLARSLVDVRSNTQTTSVLILSGIIESARIALNAFDLRLSDTAQLFAEKFVMANADNFISSKHSQVSVSNTKVQDQTWFPYAKYGKFEGDYREFFKKAQLKSSATGYYINANSGYIDGYIDVPTGAVQAKSSNDLKLIAKVSNSGLDNNVVALIARDLKVDADLSGADNVSITAHRGVVYSALQQLKSLVVKGGYNDIIQEVSAGRVTTSGDLTVFEKSVSATTFENTSGSLKAPEIKASKVILEGNAAEIKKVEATTSLYAEIDSLILSEATAKRASLAAYYLCLQKSFTAESTDIRSKYLDLGCNLETIGHVRAKHLNTSMPIFNIKSSLSVIADYARIHSGTFNVASGGSFNSRNTNSYVNRFVNDGSLYLGNANLNSGYLDFSGSSTTRFNNAYFNVSAAGFNSSVSANGMYGHIGHFNNQSTVSSSTFRVIGYMFENDGILSGSSTSLDYEQYKKFGNIESSEFAARVDDRNITPGLIRMLDGSIKGVKDLSLYTNNDIDIENSYLFMRNADLHLGAPSIVIKGNRSYITSDNLVELIATKNSIDISGTKVDASLKLKAVNNVDLQGTRTKGAVLEADAGNSVITGDSRFNSEEVNFIAGHGIVEKPRIQNTTTSYYECDGDWCGRTTKTTTASHSSKYNSNNLSLTAPFVSLPGVKVKSKEFKVRAYHLDLSSTHDVTTSTTSLKKETFFGMKRRSRSKANVTFNPFEMDVGKFDIQADGCVTGDGCIIKTYKGGTIKSPVVDIQAAKEQTQNQSASYSPGFFVNIAKNGVDSKTTHRHAQISGRINIISDQSPIIAVADPKTLRGVSSSLPIIVPTYYDSIYADSEIDMTLGAGATTLISIAASFLAAPASANLALSLGYAKGTMAYAVASGAINAGLANSFTQLSVGAFNGNLKFDAMSVVKSMAISGLTSGLVHSCADKFNINMDPDTNVFGDRAQLVGLNTAFNFGATTIVDPKSRQSLGNTLLMAGASLAAGEGARGVGIAEKTGSMNTFGQYTAHGFVAAMTYGVVSGDPLSAAVGAIAGEAAGRYIRGDHKAYAALSENDRAKLREKIELAGQVAGVLGSAAFGATVGGLSTYNPEIAKEVGLNAVRNNAARIDPAIEDDFVERYTSLASLDDESLSAALFQQYWFDEGRYDIPENASAWDDLWGDAKEMWHRGSLAFMPRYNLAEQCYSDLTKGDTGQNFDAAKKCYTVAYGEYGWQQEVFRFGGLAKGKTLELSSTVKQALNTVTDTLDIPGNYTRDTLRGWGCSTPYADIAGTGVDLIIYSIPPGAGVYKGVYKVGGVVYNSTKFPWKAAVTKYPSLSAVGKLTRGGGKGAVKRAGLAPGSVNNAVKLKTELAFKEAGILNQRGELTKRALEEALPSMGGRQSLNNPSVIRELTKDGSKITDWGKFKTKSIRLPNGQRRQIHFYQNKKTGEVNYGHVDFKVADEINFMGKIPQGNK